MADISDVEQAFVNTITSTLYPKGDCQTSIIGPLCRVYRGWPNTATLNSDLAASTINITVTAENTAGRTTTRYLPNWQTISSQAGVTTTNNASVITIGGNPISGDVVGMLVDGNAYVYRIRDGDTPPLVAASLAQLIKAPYLASVTGADVNVPGATSVSARVVCDQASFYESRRQEKDLRVILWCSSPLIRDASASAVDTAFAALAFLPMQDDTTARVVYKNTESFDQAQNALLYRRDLIYSVEYSTVSTVQTSSMLFGASDLNGSIIYD